MTPKSEVLAEYAREIAKLRADGERKGMSSSEVESLISASLDAAIPKPSQLGRIHSLLCGMWWLLKSLLLAAVLYALVACHSPTQKTLSRHIQSFIYPFMRNLRKITLPVLRAYPDLSEWHEEPCLVRNPLYGVRGPDCWPCEGVRSVLVLSKSPPNFAETYYHNGLPFVVQAGSSEVGWQDLKQLLHENSDTLQHSAPRVTAENFASSSLSLVQLLEFPERNVSEMHQTAHLTWKITRSDSARVLRQVFPRPTFVPGHTEVAIQRFLFIDSPQAPAYSLPLTDFANVWVAQGTGVRLLGLAPSPHCGSRCHPVSLLLQPGDILFYNWQFWRPRSLPVQGSTSLSITFVGSFY